MTTVDAAADMESESNLEEDCINFAAPNSGRQGQSKVHSILPFHRPNCRITQSEFINICSRKESLIRFLVEHDCFEEKKKCPNCGDLKKLNLKSLSYRCNKLAKIKLYGGKKIKRIRCKWEKSARFGTFLEKNKLPMQKTVLYFMYWLYHPYPRQSFIMENLDLPLRVVVRLGQFCREVVEDWAIQNSQILGGDQKVVELYEAKVGKRKHSKDYLLEGQWVYAGIERDSYEVLVIPVSDPSAEQLLEVIKNWILPKTTVISDCFKSYNCVEEKGYKDQIINCEKKFSHVKGKSSLDDVWLEARSKIPRYNCRKPHFLGYLAEFMFKAKYRNTLERPHHFFLQIAIKYLCE